MTALKTLVLALVLANLGYFLWAREIAAPARGARNAGSTPSTIRLASEAAGRANVRGAPAEAAARDRSQKANGATTASADAGGATADGMRATGQPPDRADRCVSIGPFRDVAEAARAAASLRSGGHATRQRVAEGEVWTSVWIYLPRPESRAASDQLIARLRTAGIDDALEMPGPNDSPVVSLGLFSEPKRAQARVALAQSIGLKPQLADRKRNGDVYFIDVDLKAGDTPPSTADFRGEAGRILRLEVASCPAPPPLDSPAPPATAPL